jgi:hypothetical protein
MLWCWLYLLRNIWCWFIINSMNNSYSLNLSKCLLFFFHKIVTSFTYMIGLFFWLWDNYIWLCFSMIIVTTMYFVMWRCIREHINDCCIGRIVTALWINWCILLVTFCFDFLDAFYWKIARPLYYLPILLHFLIWLILFLLCFNNTFAFSWRLSNHIHLVFFHCSIEIIWIIWINSKLVIQLLKTKFRCVWVIILVLKVAIIMQIVVIFWDFFEYSMLIFIWIVGMLLSLTLFMMIALWVG